MKFSKYVFKAVTPVIALFQKQHSCSSNRATTICGKPAESLRQVPIRHNRRGVSTEIKARFVPPTMCRLTLSRVELLFPPTAALPQIKSDISFILSILTCCFLRHVFFCPLDHFPSFPYSLFVTNRKRERTAPPTVRSFSSPIQVLQKQVRCRVMP